MSVHSSNMATTNLITANICSFGTSKNPSNLNTAMMRLLRNEPFLVVFCRITKGFAIHVWTINWSIWRYFSFCVAIFRCCVAIFPCGVFSNFFFNVYWVCSRCLHRYHDSLHAFAAFAAVRNNKFGAFDIHRCCALSAYELCTLIWTQLKMLFLRQQNYPNK